MWSRCVVTLMLAQVLFAGSAPAQELWVGKDGNIRNIDTRAMVISGGHMYLATSNELYRAAASSEKWEPIFSLPAGENEIQCAAGRPGCMLIGTKKGVFISPDNGRTWSLAFKAITPEKNDIRSIGVTAADRIVVGTGKGAYSSEDAGAKWHDSGGILKNMRIDCVACGKAATYAAAEGGVYVRREGNAEWDRIYVASREEEAAVYDEPGAVESGPDIAVTCLAIQGSRLYAGIGGKISYTEDDGKSWTALPSSGLKGNISCVLPSEMKDSIFCSTNKGVYQFSKEKNVWIELYRGSDKPLNVRKLIFGKEGEDVLWAATEKGLYKYEVGKSLPDETFDIERAQRAVNVIYDGEPSFKELQAAAMKFGEVDPEKIKSWRAQARLSALVPKINLGFDNNVSNTYEIYTSATKDYITTGPDDISKGFDVSVSWELGDMIWSDDQTNIDVRSRLTTQLRNDILDDLRRAYYERKRLQFEIYMTPPKDIRMRFEKELRVKELAQVIDDLTGNYLTENTGKTDDQTSDL